MNSKKWIWSLLLLGFFLTQSHAQEADQVIEVSSLDAKLNLIIQSKNHSLTYRIDWRGEQLMGKSELSLFGDRKYVINRVTNNSINEMWQPLWGQFSNILNHYNESVIDLDYEGVATKLIARVYDNGVAFRFIVKANPTIKEAIYTCDFNFPSGSQIYYPPSREREPVGPVLIKAVSQKINMPVVVKTPSGAHLSILESDLYSAPGFEVINFETKQDLLYATNKVETTTGEIVTPWRVILFEERIGNLVVNTVPLNLAATNQIKDVSWIKPGKTLWDWRVHGYTAPDGFQYGINTESYLRFIDFAAENNIEYFLIDDAWYEDVNPMEIIPSEKVDLTAVSQYAKERGVDLILYYDRKKGDYGDENLFEYYQSLGMRGIKYGFMRDDVSFTRNAIEQSAKHELLINFHDRPVPFTGISRTFPNAITKEYCHAQQDGRRAFTPEAFIKMALINAIQGPLDMNNGNFDITGINAGKRDKGPKILDSYPTTVVSEVARTLIIFSGLVCLPDAPEAYQEKEDLFEFIKQQPVGQWDESRILYAKIDRYITTARRYGGAWFVGSVAGHQGATLDINLNFLEENTIYRVTYYEDTPNTHYITNPEAYQVRHGTVQKGDVIKIDMAPGGGHGMWIRPQKSY